MSENRGLEQAQEALQEYPDFLAAGNTIGQHTATEEVMVFVNALVDIYKEIAELEALIEARNAERVKLEQEIIPVFMDANGLTDLKLTNGMKLTVGEDLSATLPKKDPVKRKEALDWLRDNGAAAKIQTTAVIEGITDAQCEQLIELGLSFDKDITVNAAALKGWLREFLGMKKNTIAQGLPDVVSPALGLYIYRTTDLK